MPDRSLWILPGGRGGHDESGARARGFGKQAVLLFVAGIELVSTDERERSGHDP